ncbi:MAG TPA: nucleoside-diphosphate kinase [bacterium]|nr:nucleoside-diphosphate kinase [bacterium]
MHASSNEEDAKREISLWFEEDEIASNYERSDQQEHFLSKED